MKDDLSFYYYYEFNLCGSLVWTTRGRCGFTPLLTPLEKEEIWMDLASRLPG